MDRIKSPEYAPFPSDSYPIEYGRASVPWRTVLLVGALLAVFVLQWWLSPTGCTSSYSLGHCVANRTMETAPAIALLALPFLHANLAHLLSNLIAIGFLGVAYEQESTGVGLIPFVLVIAYLSIFADITYGVMVGTGGIAIGASGVTRALGAFLLVNLLVGGLDWLHRVSPIERRPFDLTVVAIAIVGMAVSVYLFSVSVAEAAGWLDLRPADAIVAHLVGTLLGIGAGIRSV